MKYSLRSCFALLACLGMISCKPAAQNNDEIRIGEFASLTGKEAAFGTESHKGTQMAIDQINAAGGVLGKQIKLIVEDNQSKKGESAIIARKLISRDKVVALLGEVASGRSLEAASVCQQNSIPQVSPSSTNPKVTETGNYIFRVCFIDPFQGTVMAQFVKSLNIRKIAMLTDSGAAYSVGLGEFFRTKFLADGGELVLDQKYNSGDKDFKAQLTAIKAANAEAIFIPGYYTEVGLIARQSRQLGLNIPMFGGDGWEAPELVQIGGDALEGSYFSTHYSPEDKSTLIQNFVSQFRAKYNNQTPDAMAALGYDSAQILVDAIRRAGSVEPDKIRAALASTKDYKAVTGIITIDENRNASKPAVVLTVKGGKYQYVQTVAP